jgi:hypothetical protein
MQMKNKIHIHSLVEPAVVLPDGTHRPSERQHYRLGDVLGKDNKSPRALCSARQFTNPIV